MSARVANHYPPNALKGNSEADPITNQEASTLDQLFRERVRRDPEKVAYSQYDKTTEQWYGLTWSQMAAEVERWQVAFKDSSLVKGDRVAICYKNSIEWVIFDQAALRLGLVVVPLYTADRADNIAYVIADSRSKLVLFESQKTWLEVVDSDHDLRCVETVLVFESAPAPPAIVKNIGEWLPENGQHLERGVTQACDLASIVYTSGTTGRAKGVMLSHRNMLSNAYAGMCSVAVLPSDRLLSILPLSHTLERTVAYYGSILCGASVTFNRSIAELSTDLLAVRPTVIISVPRIFERIHNQIYQGLNNLSPLKRGLFNRAIKTGWHAFEYRQGRAKWHPRLLFTKLLDKLVAQAVRAKLGGQLRFAIVGGAPLAQEIAKTFISLRIPLLQGYGLTESSPIVSVNTLVQNKPETIGLPLRGVEVKLMENDELCIKGANVMLGYWGMPEATSKTMDGDWLKSGDRAGIDDEGFIRIIGRIKDILVLANGEKLPPPDIEAAILRDTIFDQVMVVGEGKVCLVALAVVNQQAWQSLCQKTNLNTDLHSTQAKKYLLGRIAKQMAQFPGYAKIRGVYASSEEWTVESGLLTPTLKIKRPQVLEHFKSEIESLYAGHGVRRS